MQEVLIRGLLYAENQQCTLHIEPNLCILHMGSDVSISISQVIPHFPLGVYTAVPSICVMTSALQIGSPTPFF